MLTPSKTFHQLNLLETGLLLQLDATDSLLQFAAEIPWHEFDDAFSVHYTKEIGSPSKPTRLMAGLLILKQWENLNDEAIVLQWKAILTIKLFAAWKSSSADCHA
ncbi:MAG: hypothetical protein A4S08_04685 [Proteobacteria bacterium SG_bin4]|nr:MAG: hypothetical protein A4S08_04685 [Proteobacteria bacterium SG_bin4]